MATVADIVEFLDSKCHRAEVAQDTCNIRGAEPVLPGDDGCIGFWTPKAKSTFEEVVSATKNSLILVPQGTIPSNFELGNVSVLEVSDPRTTYMQILNQFLVPARQTGIHARATVETEHIGEGIFVGAGAVIGPHVRIGKNCSIHANAVIQGAVSIGDDVIVGPNTVIGFTGFGYGRDEVGMPVAFPHFGGVTIGDRVEIGSNTSIDQGTLSNTVIEDDVKIDNLVHIAHNCYVESGAFVIAGVVLCGGTHIGKNSWIAPNSTLIEKVSIGKNAVVGLAATVLRNVPDDDVVVGSPAKSIRRTHTTSQEG